MHRTLPPTQTPSRGAGSAKMKQLFDHLRESVRGEVRFDNLSRTIYATDASIYEIVPAGVVLPRDVEDVVTVVRACREFGTSIIPRGAGTGLTGGAVGPGVQLDLSRYMNDIGPLDIERRTIEVGPGVVLDELNAHLRQHGLQFAPDTATSSRATIGGMIANNSCGARSIVYGRTVDYVESLSVVLPDGEVVTFHSDQTKGNADTNPSPQRVRQIEAALTRIRDENAEEIQRRFPKVLRSNGGYGLDRLGRPGTPVNAVKILCGSEGTLGIVVRAKLRLIPLPKHVALVVLHFDDLFEALGAVPELLEHAPSAVELVDRLILDAGLANAAIRRRCGFLRGKPEVLLIVELLDDDAQVLRSRLETLAKRMEDRRSCHAAVTVCESDGQRNVWNLRKSGLGLLMSRPGDSQPYAFVEDSAVDPARLRDYIERFTAILRDEGVQAGYYAHASVGCIHVRPVLNLKRSDDVQRMRRIADTVSSLALEFGGAMTGEHGDGIVRSCWIEKMYGPAITAAFKQVKQLFDPGNLMNPGKIVDPWPMTEHLRYGANFRQQSVKTHLDFSAYGGLAGMAQMCSGVGQCRQRLVGTMCPSFVATNDETHTTRARANALRVALANRGLLDGLDDPHLAEVMDLCISCKACKTECPTGVDMARIKAEYLAHRNLRHGVGRRSRLIADLPHRLRTAAHFPRVFNFVAQSAWFRSWLEHRYGMDRRVTLPRLAGQTFRSWFRRRQSRRTADEKPAPHPRGSVVYLIDTWMNYFTPQVGIAVVTLLERAGFEVLCPELTCCGRPAISQGLLSEARWMAEYNMRRLAPLAAASVPIVGTEPSCTLTLVDEIPQLLRTPAAKRVAEQTRMMESFLRELLDQTPDALPFRPTEERLLYHAHCHQKALVGSSDAVALMRRVWGERASEVNSGCCGMAGSFGHEVEHYDVARAIGEQRLFPALRARGDAHVAVSGFSCRQQIEHHLRLQPRHVMELLADALV